MKGKNMRVLSALSTIMFLAAASPALSQGTLFVQNDRVGIGTDNPQAPLHIQQTVGEPNIRLETLDTAAVKFQLKNSAGEWEFIAGPVGAFNFNRVGQAGNQFVFAPWGSLIIQGTLSQGSSRTFKKDFTPVDGSKILEKVSELPLSEWSYKQEDVRHLGPMAEDFRAAFGLGADPKHLAPGDVAGIALAAIQELNVSLQEKDARIEELEKRLDTLQTMVAELTKQ